MPGALDFYSHSELVDIERGLEEQGVEALEEQERVNNRNQPRSPRASPGMVNPRTESFSRLDGQEFGYTF